MANELLVTGNSLPEYDQKFALELAYGLESPLSICERYGVSAEEFEVLQNSPQFRATISRFIAELQKSGSTFRMKAAVLAEDLLKMAHVIASDDRTPAIVRLECVKFLSKVSGLDESTKKDIGPSGNNSFQININLGPPV